MEEKIVDELLDETLSKFITLRTLTMHNLFLKSMFEEVQKHCKKELTETAANRFRTVTDYNFRAISCLANLYWQFYPTTPMMTLKCLH